MESLRLQEHPSPLLLCTATPSPYLENMAREYGATYCVNPHAPGIGSDWNFAMEQAKAAGYDLVTLCHQDDLYLPGYGAAVQAMASPDMLIYFSGYGEKRGEEVVTSSRLLRIKRLLLWRMRIRPFQRSRLINRNLMRRCQFLYRRKSHLISSAFRLVRLCKYRGDFISILQQSLQR